MKKLPCSSCSSFEYEESMYKNKITGELFCINCVLKEKKKREERKYQNIGGLYGKI